MLKRASPIRPASSYSRSRVPSGRVWPGRARAVPGVLDPGAGFIVRLRRSCRRRRAMLVPAGDTPLRHARTSGPALSRLRPARRALAGRVGRGEQSHANRAPQRPRALPALASPEEAGALHVSTISPFWLSTSCASATRPTAGPAGHRPRLEHVEAHAQDVARIDRRRPASGSRCRASRGWPIRAGSRRTSCASPSRRCASRSRRGGRTASARQRRRRGGTAAGRSRRANASTASRVTSQRPNSRTWPTGKSSQ